MVRGYGQKQGNWLRSNCSSLVVTWAGGEETARGPDKDQGFLLITEYGNEGKQ